MNITRKRFLTLFTRLCASINTASIAVGAYLESDESQPVRDKVTERSPIIRPDPRPDNPVKELVRRLQVGNPTSYRDLTIYPLLVKRSYDQDIHTLDHALARDWIIIKEQDRASVSSLLVRNDSRHKVFIMAGEIITGGKQNRIIKSDVLLPARSGFVNIPVYCGEKERWTASKGKFKSGRQMASQSLRKMAAKAETQDSIWREIDGQMKEAEVVSPTRDYHKMLEDKKVSRELDKCVSSFRRFCRKRTVGAVVVSRGRILSCDFFSDEELMSAMWDKICRSYAVGFVSKPKVRGLYPGSSQADVRRFLNNILSARMTEENTPGSGYQLRISGTAEGSALILKGRVVHTAVFPGAHVHIRKPRRPEPERKYRTEDKLWR